MAKKKITEIVYDMLREFIRDEEYDLYHIEYVKEGKDWFLRVYIDKANEDESYIGTEDCEKVSRFLSEKLDEEDPIEGNYFLEVSSPGLDRPLITSEHYASAIGRDIEVKLYKAKDGTKMIYGTLQNIEDDRILVNDYDNKQWELQMDEIAKANLAVIF